MARVIGPNSFVVLDYTLRDSENKVLDASSAPGGEPMAYVHGYGMIVPGLEKAVVGLEAGDTLEVVVPADEAYGERDEELVMEVERSEHPKPKDVKVGDELVAEAPDGEEAVLRVIDVTPDSIVLDGNHPLAGEALRYAIVVREVREATDGEIADAAAAFERARSDGGEGEPEGVVQLRRGRVDFE